MQDKSKLQSTASYLLQDFCCFLPVLIPLSIPLACCLLWWWQSLSVTTADPLFYFSSAGRAILITRHPHIQAKQSHSAEARLSAPSPSSQLLGFKISNLSPTPSTKRGSCSLYHYLCDTLVFFSSPCSLLLCYINNDFRHS